MHSPDVHCRFGKSGAPKEQDRVLRNRVRITSQKPDVARTLSLRRRDSSRRSARFPEAVEKSLDPAGKSACATSDHVKLFLRPSLSRVDAGWKHCVCAYSISGTARSERRFSWQRLTRCLYLRRRQIPHDLIFAYLVDHQFVGDVAALCCVELHRLVDFLVLLLGELVVR